MRSNLCAPVTAVTAVRSNFTKTVSEKELLMDKSMHIWDLSATIHRSQNLLGQKTHFVAVLKKDDLKSCFFRRADRTH